MACPYFWPEKEADFAFRPRPARAPLGSVFNGACHARPDAPQHPSDDVLYESCNFGYGRGQCPLFPDSSEYDAVRFTSWRGNVVFIYEKDHMPVKHGNGATAVEHILRRQIDVFSHTTCPTS